MFLSEWRNFLRRVALQGGEGGGKKNLMTARVSMLLKSRSSLTCFRAYFLPGSAKDLSTPQYMTLSWVVPYEGYIKSPSNSVNNVLFA